MFIKIKEKFRSIVLNMDKIESILYTDSQATIITQSGERYNLDNKKQIENLFSILNSHTIEI